jgi:tRNA (cytidine/uridine-2'-O-)-methyltransferase
MRPVQLKSAQARAQDDTTLDKPAPHSPREPAPRLRGVPAQIPLNVVLVEPEIPPNTGNIARLCAATGSVLHLVHPLGFSTDEKAVRRAGLDYWHLVDVREHASLAALESTRPPTSARYLFSGRVTSGIEPLNYLDVRFAPGDYLMFGRESAGLPADLLGAHPEQIVGIPMPGAVRSLNLANAVGIALYEALRQLGCLRTTP